MIQSAELDLGKPSHAWAAFSFCSHSAKACRATAPPPWQWIWPKEAVNPLLAMSALFDILLTSFPSQVPPHKSVQTSKAKPSQTLHQRALSAHVAACNWETPKPSAAKGWEARSIRKRSCSTAGTSSFDRLASVSRYHLESAGIHTILQALGIAGNSNDESLLQCVLLTWAAPLMPMWNHTRDISSPHVFNVL